jgi:transposase
MAKKITGWEAAEIIGVTDPTMRRWRERLEAEGYSGLVDRRKAKPSDKRVPVAQVEEVLRLYREEYFTTVEAANAFLRERYIAEFNQKFAVAAKEKGTAFRRATRSDLDWVFTVQTERIVAKDNTVAITERNWQLEKGRFRNSLAGCTVTIHEHLDRTVDSVWPACGRPLYRRRTTAPGRTEATPGKPWKSRGGGNRGKPQTGFPPPLGNPKEPGFPLSHRFGDGFFSITITNQDETPFGKPKRGLRTKSPKPDRLTNYEQLKVSLFYCPCRFKYPLGLKLIPNFSRPRSGWNSPLEARNESTASHGPGPKLGSTGWPLNCVSSTIR